MPNDNFEWTDADWEGIVEQIKNSTPDKFAAKWLLSQMNILMKSKESKIKEKEKIYVVSYMSNPQNANGYPMEFTFTRELKDVATVITALESVLNNEQPIAEQTDNYTREYVRKKWQDAPQQSVNQPLTGEFITKEECERREEAAWDFAREKFVIDKNPFNKQYRFLSFEQYKSYKRNQLNK